MYDMYGWGAVCTETSFGSMLLVDLFSKASESLEVSWLLVLPRLIACRPEPRLGIPPKPIPGANRSGNLEL